MVKIFIILEANYIPFYYILYTSKYYYLDINLIERET